MLEVPELAQVKHDQDGYHFAVGHFEGTIATFFAVVCLDKVIFMNFIEFFAEFVNQTENLD
jgi:hypothetical protein